MTLANQKTIATNGDGYAVLPFATAYHRNDVSLDSHSLPENVDLANSTRRWSLPKTRWFWRAFTPTLAIRRCLRCSREDNRCPLAAKYAPKTPTASLPARVRCTWPAWRQKAPCMRNGGQALSSAVAPATISPRRWRRPPSTHFTADVIMSFLTLLRRVALTLLFILLPAASGWACTPVFVRGQASTLRLNVGQLTVPADARPAPRCIIKVSPGTALATAANSGSAARTTRTGCRRCCWTVCCPE